VEHQATMAMVLMQPVMDSQWRRWLKEAIELRWAEEVDPLHKSFPVTSICRADLKEIEFTADETAALRDKDMARIARMMEDSYVENTFWESLENFAREVLAGKEST